jgi:RNA polymerase sigma factor (sigma-70 family)
LTAGICTIGNSDTPQHTTKYGLFDKNTTEASLSRPTSFLFSFPGSPMTSKKNNISVNRNHGTLPDTAPEVIDMLPVHGRGREFMLEVADLALSSPLYKKIKTACKMQQSLHRLPGMARLTQKEENELATETLMLRQKFTEQVFARHRFRQAAITVIQNTYLFRNRRIFFQPDGNTAEEERQKALLMLTTSPLPSITLAFTFQHPVIARIWARINSTFTDDLQEDTDWLELVEIIGKLNTIRNIFVSMSLGLTTTIAAQTPQIYREGLTIEDLVQIATFGLARAAYRFHPSSGTRFSTFSSRWIQKEIQRQALQSRLIRISSHTVEQRNRRRSESNEGVNHYADIINDTSDLQSIEDNVIGDSFVPAEVKYEQEQLRKHLLKLINTKLSEKSADILRRRYGLPPWEGESQSVLKIAEHYGVSRSSIYQLEQNALKRLRRSLASGAPAEFT